MTPPPIPAALGDWIIAQAMTGQPPEQALQPLLDQGWNEQDAIDAVEALLRDHIHQHAQTHGLPVPVRVPAVLQDNDASLLDLGDRQVRVLVSLLLPRVVVLGDFLSDAECEALIALAQPRLARSRTVDNDNGAQIVHAARTSHSMCLQLGQDALCQRIEARIARLLDWPVDHGEGLQVLRYATGAEYQPHYDYFDPAAAGTPVLLQAGGQRVASLVMYLNTPERGGATRFPDAHLDVAAVKGNAVFFSYDRPHPMTRSLHAGAPVLAGEKWVATKWLRERAVRMPG
ncbi:2OG-Fe(II) oxygenase [Xanthomonas arboricola]|jgi:prolyl 4-hydroxylase|uniref:2OG-Fe(II) oxygenase n=1 Tax=Xanthomonas arboricola TaxID=56448 RepID=UPI00141B7475|nr:2OG-Fe(II) oxygenase [Xanthomonas arboricola]MBB3762419.1 prolyl 4-hydroxylase [Xanthomonas arboricola]MBB4727325.1 prolyl 4-hydroxylase [Xanthomonas arboricola]NIK45071.1 prolyl 4-hydroxylase [Xanthomonas arboricola]